MKIIYVGIESENYNPARRPSFEYSNFYLQLKAMPGVETIEYPYDPIVTIGKKRFNKELLELIDREKPDLFFAFMYSDEFDVKTLETIKQKTNSIAWFGDDHWRLWNYSRHYAPHFTWAVTTWSKAPELYAQYGIKNIIRSQWACNLDKQKAINAASFSSAPAQQARLAPQERQGKSPDKDIDVSFVGQRTDKRAYIIGELRRAGITVYVRGWGWVDGRASEKGMTDIFLRSKINLNINDSPNLFKPKYLARLFLRRSLNRFVPSLNILDNFKSWKGMAIPQIKARPFELSARNAFVISGYADDLDAFYTENEEMVFYRNTKDLIDKIVYYLPREDERMQIAQAAHDRTLREHTYEKRFQEIFNKCL